MSGLSDSETFFINFQSTPRDSFVNFYELMAVLNWFFLERPKSGGRFSGILLGTLEGFLGIFKDFKDSFDMLERLEESPGF